mmetsp:Transcript_10526/g.26501  ORF Transcript_10526/g.26501 Transcript_10526/m.26501 type:complete len:303 (-) Transcript_10526:1248-2156(-)
MCLERGQGLCSIPVGTRTAIAPAIPVVDPLCQVRVLQWSLGSFVRPYAIPTAVCSSSSASSSSALGAHRVRAPPLRSLCPRPRARFYSVSRAPDCHFFSGLGLGLSKAPPVEPGLIEARIALIAAIVVPSPIIVASPEPASPAIVHALRRGGGGGGRPILAREGCGHGRSALCDLVRAGVRIVRLARACGADGSRTIAGGRLTHATTGGRLSPGGRSQACDRLLLLLLLLRFVLGGVKVVHRLGILLERLVILSRWLATHLLRLLLLLLRRLCLVYLPRRLRLLLLLRLLRWLRGCDTIAQL